MNIFQLKKFDIFLIFAQNIDTHNLCFGAKIRKIGIPVYTPGLLYKSGVQWVYITRTCFRDVYDFTLIFCLEMTGVKSVEPRVTKSKVRIGGLGIKFQPQPTRQGRKTRHNKKNYTKHDCLQGV